MNFRVPDSEPKSSDEEDSFVSQESYTMSEQVQAPGSNVGEFVPAAHEQLGGPSVPEEQRSQPHTNAGESVFSHLSSAQYEALYNRFASEFLSQNLPAQQPSIATQRTTFIPKPSSLDLTPTKKANKWPTWDGSITTLRSYLVRLKAKIEEDRYLLGSDRAVCLGILDSVPDDKKLRISHWFETGGPKGDYDWRLFLNHLKDQFEDKLARQRAGNLLSRMRMGPNQYFADYLQDFEFKLSQCGGDMSDSNKIWNLSIGINVALQQYLVFKDLPDDDYQKWVTKVSKIAGRLESLPSYRPKGCSGKKTWYLPQNGSLFSPTFENQIQTSNVDADGDTKMGGVNAMKVLQAAINALNVNPDAGENTKPRAKWRTQEEFARLINEGKCTRCKKKGHKSRACSEFRPAKRSTTVSYVNGSAASKSPRILSGKAIRVDESESESESNEIDNGNDNEFSGED